MVFDCVNKEGLEPIAGRKGQVELPGPKRKKERFREEKGILQPCTGTSRGASGHLGPAASTEA